MKLFNRPKLHNVIAGILSAALVLTSFPATVLATDEAYLIEDVLAGQDSTELTDTVVTASEATGEFAGIPEGGATLVDGAEDVQDNGVIDITEGSEAVLEEDAIENGFSDDIISEDSESVLEEDVTEDVSSDGIISDEEQIASGSDPAIVEENMLVAADAVADKTTVKGKRSFFYTNFTAELNDVAVKVVASNLYVKKDSEMQVAVLSTVEYQDVIEAQNYGKVLVDGKEIQLSFFDKQGREFTPIGIDVTVEAKTKIAESYTLYRTNGDSVRRIASSVKPVFNFYSSHADTFILAGLVDDGVLRVEGKKKSGNTVFALDKEGVDITVTAPKGAFYGTVSMEVFAKDESWVLDKLQDSDIIAAEAYDFAFHAGSSEEIAICAQ